MSAAILDQPIAQTEWWRPGKSMVEVHESTARVRFLVGARGSAKTATAVMEAIRHCLWNCGAKVMIVRKTEVSQADTTLDSVRIAFEKMGDLYQDTGASLFSMWDGGRSIRLPSLKAIEAFNNASTTWQTKQERQQWIESEGDRLCGRLEFRGLPHAKANENTLRGFECSMMILIEADLLTLTDFQMAVPCLRWKGTDPETCDENGFIIDSGIIVETNPPSPRHWIAQLEDEWKKGMQPGFHFWHIKMVENEHNLPPGYVDAVKHVYRHNPAMYRRMVDGEYADAFDGKPCYYNFHQSDHASEDLPWPIGAYLIESMDFGTCNATVWSAYWQEKEINPKDGSIITIDEYWHCLCEQYLEGSDTERQAIGIIETRDREFSDENGVPFWNNRAICAGVLQFCDPSGDNQNFTTRGTGSAVKILSTHGIHPGTMLWNRGIEVGITIGNRMMAKKDRKGRFIFRIDKNKCPHLHSALVGGYRYPEPGESGYNGDKSEPLKGLTSQDFDFSHIADALRYGFMNSMTLLRAEHEKLKAPKHHAGPRRNPNPNKRR